MVRILILNQMMQMNIHFPRVCLFFFFVCGFFFAPVPRMRPAGIKEGICFGMFDTFLVDVKNVIPVFKEFRREAFLMSHYVHPNLVGLRGIVLNPLCLITEFMGCGDLFNFIHDTAKEISFSTVIKASKKKTE